ncbi:MAG: VOC family protein [Rhodobacteraceae bacterium]|nr:VOC family protein [Paracoccaceae bacterium]MBR9821515.1 VOC family protein [Paracoccaceae bacterium]
MSTDSKTTVIWAEIPVTDLARGTAFYEAVFGWTLTQMQMGPDRVAAFGSGGVGGNLVEGPGGMGAGNVIHLLVPDTVEAALSRAQQAGARAETDVITIPPGRYAVVRDPDGNRIGLFEAA